MRKKCVAKEKKSEGQEEEQSPGHSDDRKGRKESWTGRFAGAQHSREHSDLSH